MKFDPKLIKSMGETIAHSTTRQNAQSILENGFLTPAEIARSAGISPSSIILRRERIEFRDGSRTVTLNHQLPILHGIQAATQMLEGHTPESWAEQLDQRVFFWPRGGSKSFSKSRSENKDVKTLFFDTETFLERLLDRIDLCPINSGNFRQGGANARRGDWIYVPAADGIQAFRTNRMSRGLAKSTDTIKEISVRGAISRDDVNACLIKT